MTVHCCGFVALPVYCRYHHWHRRRRRRSSRPSRRRPPHYRSVKSTGSRKKFHTRRVSCHFSPPVSPPFAPPSLSTYRLRRIIRRAALPEVLCVLSRLYATASWPSRVIVLEFRRFVPSRNQETARRPLTVHQLSVAVRGSSVIGAFAGRRRSSAEGGSTPPPRGLERATSSSADTADRGWRTTARCKCVSAFLFAFLWRMYVREAIGRGEELTHANAARGLDRNQESWRSISYFGVSSRSTLMWVVSATSGNISRCLSRDWYAGQLSRWGLLLDSISVFTTWFYISYFFKLFHL